jgi:hypothetical protein
MDSDGPLLKRAKISPTTDSQIIADGNSNGNTNGNVFNDYGSCRISVSLSMPLPQDMRVSALTTGQFDFQTNANSGDQVLKNVPATLNNNTQMSNDQEKKHFEGSIIVGAECGSILLFKNNQASD